MNIDFKLNGKKIITDRLILRPFIDTDLDDFFEYASVPGVGEMAGWSTHKNKDETKNILNMFISEDKTFAICLKSSGKVIGSLGIEKYGKEEALTEFSNLKGREIGFVLSKNYWGQGLMPEAVNVVIDYLFNELDLDFLTCGHFNSNSQSKRVQEKCGFKPYRKLNFDTRIGTVEPGVLNLLLNPEKSLNLVFSHPETLIYRDINIEETTLCYIKKDNCFLMLLRNKKQKDLNKGKWIGIGGHVESGETIFDAAKREVLEETGLSIENPKYRAKLLFINNDYSEIMHLFTAEEFAGELIDCDEGTLSWVPIENLDSLNLWEGDKEFLRLIKDDKEPYFEMNLYYSDDKFVKSERTL